MRSLYWIGDTQGRVSGAAVLNLTLHGDAGGFWEKRDEEEVEEVDEGQSIVSEQTCCGENMSTCQRNLELKKKYSITQKMLTQMKIW